VELNLRGFDHPDVKIIDFSLLVMKHLDLSFDQSSTDHRFENVAPARAVSTLFRIAQLRLSQPRDDNFSCSGDSHGLPLRSASDVRPTETQKPQPDWLRLGSLG
jgi:hypothetical protein